MSEISLSVPSKELSVRNHVVDEAVEFEQQIEFGGYNNTGYPGGFPARVIKRIESIVQSPCLHLFSGSSRIGDVRIDLKHPNATNNLNVYEFIQEDERNWKFVLLDPDYHISRKDVKLKVHGLKDSVGGNKLAEKLLAQYFQKHTENVLWFDLTSFCFQGFFRHKVWFYLMGASRPIRALTWLKREGVCLNEELDFGGAFATDKSPKGGVGDAKHE